jgi:hypothetical protein
MFPPHIGIFAQCSNSEDKKVFPLHILLFESYLVVSSCEGRVTQGRDRRRTYLQVLHPVRDLEAPIRRLVEGSASKTIADMLIHR